MHLYELLGLAGLPPSKHFNAKYGLDTVLCILIAMCESSCFVTLAIAPLARHAEDSPIARVPAPLTKHAWAYPSPLRKFRMRSKSIISGGGWYEPYSVTLMRSRSPCSRLHSSQGRLSQRSFMRRDRVESYIF